MKRGLETTNASPPDTADKEQAAKKQEGELPAADFFGPSCFFLPRDYFQGERS